MREIKFRAWHKKAQKMSENTVTIQDAYDNEGFTNAEECEWLQYTGRWDNKGVEMYEGYIVSIIFKANRWVESVAEIKFQNHEIVFWNDNEIVQAWHEPNPWYKSARQISWPDCQFEFLEIKVIGNIYENKELIK